ncbi:DJ-1 family glyoxalase III [Limosilactobacillus sp.]|jgi:4-methyl-5(b-hydroxyethyl)-thiazole monophosphate biosynthesis|uniref:DJ-1 family glyoxalase III n=1 Tax=Limosilactobacillus sp. TaxID=2773925 RepID=UPI0025BC2947|nr:DJ-1 family glyoxalase III [Limosilactobacillus sp.]MCH3921302.1 DJ-1/PfpI family protein [Limosilactobacillus sp.]MCH3928073.1 DJ-1/PfpI family protein [Limosilactobacillus sp.]
MAKVAVVFAPGCEEVEGLSIIDVLRRMGIDTTMVGLENLKVPGAHGIELTCDTVMDDSLLDYDVVAFPGGRGGAQKLRDNTKLADLMRERNRQGKWDAAMCAAPIALAKYGLLDGRDYTCFPGINEEVDASAKNAHFKEDITVVDEAGKVITSRGPATALAFAFQIAEVLGYDTKQIKHEMLYDYLLAQK